MYTRRNMQLGYTLAELLISLAIIGIAQFDWPM